MDTVCIEIGKRIKELRKSYKLNQTDFARPLGVSYGHISNLEQGKDMPSQALVRLMAHEYNTSIEWIMEGKGDRFTHKPYKDRPSNMQKTDRLMLELDDLMCVAPSSTRSLQENILESIILFFNANSLLKANYNQDYLEILNNMLKNLYTLNAHLIVTKNMGDCVSFQSYRDRIEQLMDQIFENFASDLHAFKKVYVDDDFEME